MGFQVMLCQWGYRGEVMRDGGVKGLVYPVLIVSGDNHLCLVNNGILLTSAWLFLKSMASWVSSSKLMLNHSVIWLLCFDIVNNNLILSVREFLLWSCSAKSRGLCGSFFNNIYEVLLVRLVVVMVPSGCTCVAASRSPISPSLRMDPDCLLFIFLKFS